MEVRKASDADVPRIAAIHVRSWQAAYRGLLPDELLDGLSVLEREGSWRALLDEGGDRWLTLVAERSGGDLAGFCSIATPSRDEEAGKSTAEVGALYVDSDHWRQGTGSALLAAALEELGESGWREVILWVLPENRAALDFYARFGFEIEEGVEKREERSGRPVIRLRAVLAENRSARAADEPIWLSPHDPAWPARFEEERAKLEDAIGEWIVGGVHHVGSTAVPGLEAKPIIDVLVGVRDLEESRGCFEPLAGLDYLYAPYLPDEMHWFCKPHPSRRTHHLHLVPAGARRYADELAFRDRLRADPRVAADYAALKRKLAARFAQDRESYTEAKSDFIRNVLGST